MTVVMPVKPRILPAWINPTPGNLGLFFLGVAVGVVLKTMVR